MCLISLNFNKSWLKNPEDVFQDFIVPILFEDPKILKIMDNKVAQRAKVMAILEDDHVIL